MANNESTAKESLQVLDKFSWRKWTCKNLNSTDSSP